MSIRVMSGVWERSQHKSGALLVLLAIADFADDNGTAFPAVETLAEKARMTARNVQFVLRVLEKSGELVIERGGGRNGANRYRIRIPATQNGEKISPQGVKPTSPGGEKSGTKGVKPTSPEPSLTVKEPVLALAARFARWYEHYPVKKARGQAERAWEKLSPDDELTDRMIVAVDQQIAERERLSTERRFVPEWKHPATWLTARAWEDETTPVVAHTADAGRCDCGELGVVRIAGHWRCNEHKEAA
jgi:hypothetical protein